MFFYGPVVPELTQTVLEWSKRLNLSQISDHIDLGAPIHRWARIMLVCCLFGYYLLARLMEGRLSGGESPIFSSFEGIYEEDSTMIKG